MKRMKEILRVICEPTGGYEQKLLSTARRLGQLTVYVNAEAVNKFRVVESNDTGKNDLKDPHVISMVAKVGKTLTHRLLDERFVVLRREGKAYESAEEQVVGAKCRLHHLVKELFCDLSMKSDFLYTMAGKALVEIFSCDPYRIHRGGYKRFVSTIRKAAPRAREAALQQLWKDVESSVRNELPPGLVETLKREVRELWDDLKRYLKRREAIGKRMEELYLKSREKDPKLPCPTKGVITVRSAARLLAETGPLGDFSSARKLMRYAGLNLRMNQSGQHIGENRISKKGRSLLRKILANIAFSLVRRDRLYGEYYAEKKKSMAAKKAMNAVMRQFLKKFFGWYRSGEEFDRERFFTCESQLIAA